MKKMAVALALVLAGCNSAGSSSVSSPAAPELHTIEGTLTAPECGGGYNIAYAGVEVTDEDGTVVGVASTSNDVGAGALCQVEFSVPGVRRAAFYQVTIGTHGGLSYSFADMESWGWSIDLDLGRSGSEPLAAHTVTYSVTGSGKVSLTYSTKDDDTVQRDVQTPWHLSMRGVVPGTFLYLSAQNEGSGSITCTLEIDGEVAKSSTAHGRYHICDVSRNL